METQNCRWSLKIKDLLPVRNPIDRKEERRELKGRNSFFLRSNCRDCGAVRSFLREENLNFVEINVDVYTGREEELVKRTGGATVPQIFFNEKRIEGPVALISLRNSGMLDAKLEEILDGFDEADDVPAEEEDGISTVVRVARQRVPIQDCIVKMRFVKNC